MYCVSNIRKTFGDNEVLKGVTLEIPANQTTVLIGPSGSGKTTLLRCINLLEIPDSGTVDLNGASYQFEEGKKKPKLDAKPLRDIRKKQEWYFRISSCFHIKPFLKISWKVHW